MSLTYKAISFNRQKKIYARIILLAILLYLFLFFGLSSILYEEATFETIFLRATASSAFILLNIILMIGPLCRLNKNFLPLLYNRRHLGVSMFFMALFHGAFAILHFHGFGDTNPFVSLFTSNTDYLSLRNFPFQTLGFLALLIFFLMAATSHDFWLANLGAPLWKSLHMLVYWAYALVILHAALGTLQAEPSPLLIFSLTLSLSLVLGLHLLSALQEARKEKEMEKSRARDFDSEGYAYACKVQEIKEKRARIVQLSGERVAVFRYEGLISAISNVCQHQNGPLGEGKIIDGCVTCPWHGFQYNPQDGKSPPPFQEKVPVFRVKIRGDRIYVHPQALLAGSYVEPAKISIPSPLDPGLEKREEEDTVLP